MPTAASITAIEMKSLRQRLISGSIFRPGFQRLRPKSRTLVDVDWPERLVQRGRGAGC
jgi:hypothetical protein